MTLFSVIHHTDFGSVTRNTQAVNHLRRGFTKMVSRLTIHQDFRDYLDVDKTGNE
ncbi:MAG: hypothetical protein JXM70_06935 [Pirellulales bacterium]|nr:hypothetical protein [Pirellulales bacterium]